MSVRDTERPAKTKLAALEVSGRDLRDGEVRRSAISCDQGDVPWQEGHSLPKPEGALGTDDSSPIAQPILDFEKTPARPMNEALLLTPEEAARRLSLGRTTVYALMASGELLSVNIGRCRRVPLSALRSFVTRLVDDKGTDMHHRDCGGGRPPFE
jgi:excisionase family DNA binding protein